MNKKIIIILYFHLFAVEIMAQHYVFNITSAASYIDNYFTNGNITSAQVIQTKFYDARLGFKLGVEVSREIYKNIGLSVETGYSLGGFRFPSKGYLAGQLYNIHQFYAIAAPQIRLYKNWNVSIGGFYNANLFYNKFDGFQFITEKANLGLVLKLNYQIKKFNVGIRYFDYLTPYYKIGDTNEYWKTFDFVLSYRILNF